MSFEFQRDKTVEKQLRHLIASDVDDVLHMLAPRPSPRMSREKAVHESRKIFKRLRALLRLLRDSIPAKDFRRANQAFRDAGRALSATRDAKILVDAFDNLVAHFAHQLKPGALAPVRRKLVARRRQVAKEQGGPPSRQLATLLRDQKRRAQSRKLKHDGWRALAPGLQRTYHQGRQALSDATQKPTFESLHEWRKRVKDLWHQAQLLEPAWPQELKRYGDDLHALSDLLGDDHDLAVLRQTLRADPDHFGPPDQLDALVHLIEARRCELEAAATALGDRLYAEKPAQFTKRLHSYWQSWQDADTAPGVH